MLHISVAMTIYILAITFLFGACIGSFTDCMVWRIMNHESVWRGRSHCDTCNHPLGIMDLIPIFSFLLSRGRCRYCKDKISCESTLVECFLGMAFVALMVRFDVSVMAFRSMAFVTILTGLSLIDLKTFEIPDRFHYAAILLFLGTFFLHPYRESLYGLLTGCIFSCGMLFLSLLFDRINGTESLGGGDIKLFFIIGLFLQHPFLGLLHLILSCCLGLAFSLYIKKERIPFGPSISLAAFITLLFGEPLMEWYMKLLF